MWLSQFQTKANSCEDICWVSVWSFVSFWVSNKNESWWRHLLSLSLKLCKFMDFKQQRIFMKVSLESHFEVISVYEFQKKPNSCQDIWWVSVWSFVTLLFSNKIGFLWRHFLSFSLELCKFMSSKQKPILTKTYFRSKFGVT